ncbi:hypothetical protein [Actinotalea sp. K2]|uniref:hypothetical protein n=1 Tax=Actinotalea sp. K2 TaxID=2939438 RepID=UPI002016CA77|nr:hypothetical protein [Actinotalea sp. K2]MCL3862836.1 hypothetical protein [Actinotalea sp. K2]
MNPWLVTLIGAAALALSALVGAPLTAGVLRLAARSADAGGEEGAALRDEAPQDAPLSAELTRDPDLDARVGDGPVGDRSRDALRGGTWIGILERIAITGALLAGYPAAIAFVIAIKGLGRYPELRERPSASERFVIGTLASMLWAVAVGGAFRGLLTG